MNSDEAYLGNIEFDAMRYGFELLGFSPAYMKSLERLLTNKDISQLELNHMKHDIRAKLLSSDTNEEITDFIRNNVEADEMDIFLS